LSEVILTGAARDGGLYVPADDLPVITVGELERLVPLSYCERATRVLERLVHPSDVHASLLRRYVQTAFSTGHLFYTRTTVKSALNNVARVRVNCVTFDLHDL